MYIIRHVHSTMQPKGWIEWYNGLLVFNVLHEQTHNNSSRRTYTKKNLKHANIGVFSKHDWQTILVRFQSDFSEFRSIIDWHWLLFVCGLITFDKIKMTLKQNLILINPNWWMLTAIILVTSPSSWNTANWAWIMQNYLNKFVCAKEMVTNPEHNGSASINDKKLLTI